MPDSSKYANNPALNQLELGRKSHYIEHYAPHLLQPVPRALNRDQLALNSELPFHGCDCWNLYELSWLNPKGKPVVAIGQVRINADSLNLVESKSFKLYLNSFNQTQFASWDEVKHTIAQDIAACAQGQVSVELFTLDTAVQITPLAGTLIDDLDIEVDQYEFSPQWLQGAKGEQQVEETLISNLLKSNCLVTSQPDWGSIRICYQGPKIDREALLRYIISFRRHNEFHEQCVERIFMDIMHYCQPNKLTVDARYTRRGGLDINPFRSNNEQWPANHQRLIRQ